MPIPVPKSDKDMGECIKFLMKEGGRKPEQCQAICYSIYRKAHGIKEPKGK